MIFFSTKPVTAPSLYTPSHSLSFQHDVPMSILVACLVHLSIRLTQRPPVC